MGSARVEADGTKVGTGFRDAFWQDRPTLRLLDEVTGNVPTYLINADVRSVWLNSAAMRREGIHSDGVGVLREQPAFELSRRLNALDPVIGDALVTDMARRAASHGVVGLVDFDLAWNEEAWARRMANGFDVLRVEFGIYPEDMERAVLAGLRTGDSIRGAQSDLARVGPVKVITDGSLGTRTAACGTNYPAEPHNHGVLKIQRTEPVALMHRATRHGISCAIHAIGDTANRHALDAFAETGATGTIEHAQLVAPEDIPRFAELGVGVSLQPQHALDDRDLTDALWAEQSALPYPLRALAMTGCDLRFGSDAPVSPLHIPWWAPEVFDANLEIVAQLTELEESKGATLSQLSLAWILSRRNGIVPIPGSRNAEPVAGNVAASDIVPTETDLARIDQIVPTGGITPTA
jgi:predicted amidohydrolase YtcJ